VHNYFKDYDSLTLKKGYCGGVEGKQYLQYEKIRATTQDFQTLLKMLQDKKYF
jgi:hypothetical protein